MWYEGWRNDVCNKARGAVDVGKVCGFVEVQCAWKGREGTSGVPPLFRASDLLTNLALLLG